MEFATLMRRKRRCFLSKEIRRFSNNLTRNGGHKSAPQTVKKYFVCTPEAMPPECNSWAVSIVSSMQAKRRRGRFPRAQSPVLIRRSSWEGKRNSSFSDMALR